MSVRTPRRALWAAAALAVCLALLLGAAFYAQNDNSSAADPARLQIGAAIAAPASGRPAAHVAYAGSRRLIGRTLLRADVRSTGQRIVAVTFLLDGRPLGTDTSEPYALDVDASLLPAGRHRLRVVAVDRLGARSAARAVTVHTGGSRRHILQASPRRGLAAARAALARGHVTVLLGPGRYAVPRVELGSGARLVGTGRRTVLAATSAAWSLVTVHGQGVRISDLVIDGAGRAERAIGVADGSHDVRLQRLYIRGIRETGVETWGAHSSISVQDSVITGGGAEGAGVFDLGSDATQGTSVIRSSITGFRAYGINFAQRAYDRPRAALYALALDNRIRDINDPAVDNGTREGAIWSGGVAAAIIGNRIRDTGWDGIQTVGSSRGVTVVDNDIARTRTGIYLEHETTGSLFAHNVIADVTTGLNVEWRYGGAGSAENTFEDNTIVRPTETGIFVDVEGDRNRVAGNVIEGGNGPAIVLQGSSDNVVVDNRACDRPDEHVVVQQSSDLDNGRAAQPLRNRIEDNDSVPACPPRQ